MIVPFNLSTQDLTSEIAIVIPAVGNTYEIWLNNVLLDRRGDLSKFNGNDYTRSAKFIPLPLSLLDTSNHLQIRIKADNNRRAGLAQIGIGNAEAVRAHYDWLIAKQVTAPLILAMLSLSVGLLALAMWHTQRRLTLSGQENSVRIFPYVAVAELSWAIFVLYTIAEQPWISWPIWPVVAVTASGLRVWGNIGFCIELARCQQAAWAKRLLISLLYITAIGSLAAYLGYGLGYSMVILAWYLLLGGICFVFGLWLL